MGVTPNGKVQAEVQVARGYQPEAGEWGGKPQELAGCLRWRARGDLRNRHQPLPWDGGLTRVP